MASRLARNNDSEVQDRLYKIGVESFALLDELHRNHPGKSTRRPQAHPSKPRQHQYQQHHHQHHQPYVYHGPQVFTVKQNPVITNDQTAEYYDVPQVLNARQQPEFNCDRAAELYGGMVFVDHRFRP